MSISIKEVNDINYGRCIDISNGIVDVSVTIDYGPRIIRYCPKNMKNLFYYEVNIHFLKIWLIQMNYFICMADIECGLVLKAEKKVIILIMFR